MPLRRQRLVQEPRINVDELAARVKWAGLLEPAFTPEERAVWQAHQRARLDWVPPRALTYLWDRADPIHGRGGTHYLGQPRRADDPGTGDVWKLSRFQDALAEDGREIERVGSEHPEQADRLRVWLRAMKALGLERDRQPDPDVGHFYEACRTLGYQGSELEDCLPLPSMCIEYEE